MKLICSGSLASYKRVAAVLLQSNSICTNQPQKGVCCTVLSHIYQHITKGEFQCLPATTTLSENRSDYGGTCPLSMKLGGLVECFPWFIVKDNIQHNKINTVCFHFHYTGTGTCSFILHGFMAGHFHSFKPALHFHV
jgi:hypothetical protein